MDVIETDRLVMRRQCAEDAPFILRLVNDPAWLRHIGDRGVRTLDEARTYILNGAVAMYDRCGFGLYLVETRNERTPVGICGLLKRDTLDDADIGFAFAPEFRGLGYAREAAAATLAHARSDVSLDRVAAIVSAENADSIRLLRRLGFTFDREMDAVAGVPVHLYALSLSSIDTP